MDTFSFFKQEEEEEEEDEDEEEELHKGLRTVSIRLLNNEIDKE